MQTDITVIGGGPAGLMAAIEAARRGARVLLLESGPGPGRKLLATGGGRCNLTHAGTPESFLAAFEKGQARFLRHAAHGFSPDDAARWFESLGVPLKTERGDRVFPASDRARDVLDALLAECRTAGVEIRTASPVRSVVSRDGSFAVETPEGTVDSAALVIATGGLSMRRTGSTGDGYRLAGELGHTVTSLRPSLVPLVTMESWPGDVAGLALKNVRLSAFPGGKRISRFGEMLFTHHGVGGPIVLEISRFLTDILHDGGGPVRMEIDLKPALEEHILDARLVREFAKFPKRHLGAVLSALMPRSLAEVFSSRFGFDPSRDVSHIPRAERTRLRLLLKALPLEATGTEPMEAALVTRGGVALAELDARTMESKILSGLFFAGEIVDLDGDCGGYNLHLCWATGRLAGISAARRIGALRLP